MIRRLRTLLAVALLGLALPAGALARAHLNPYALQGDFMCVICHEPLNQVNDVESNSEKQTLAQLADQGLDLSQIKARMVQYYGEEVLAAPPAKGVNLLVYILPPLVLLAGLVFIAVNLPRWRKRSRLATAAALAAAGTGTGPPGLAPEDADRLDAELRAFRG